MTCMIKCALFDLDGTLVDTSIDLGRATDFVLEAFGREAKWTDTDYRKFVGNGARKLLERAFEHTLSESELDKALEIFKKRYNEILLDNAHMFDGVKDALDNLKEQGIKLAVVTNKPHQSAIIMTTKLFGSDYFDSVLGADDNKPKKPDPWQVVETLKKFNIKADDAIYFGDSDIDVYTAKNAGVESVACSWGYRSFECLLASAPSVIIDKPSYIPKLV